MNKLANTVKKIYETKYKLLAIIPLLILLSSILYLGFVKINTDEFIQKDVSLSGGAMITINTNEKFIAKDLESQLENTRVRQIKATGASEILGYSFESNHYSIDELKEKITSLTSFEFNEGTYSIEETSSALSSAFWSSAIKAMILAFIFIGTVVFIYFRKVIPSTAIVLSAVSDIIITIAILNIFNITLSTAGIAAILMLIGYSVDSNILLTTKVLKRKKELTESIFTAMKTGITMQTTTIVALSAIFFFSPAEVLKSITLILIIGILIDTMNTWIQNAGILTWWSKKWEK